MSVEVWQVACFSLIWKINAVPESILAFMRISHVNFQEIQRSVNSFTPVWWSEKSFSPPLAFRNARDNKERKTGNCPCKSRKLKQR